VVLPAQPTPHDDMDAETPRAEPRTLEARDVTTHLEQNPQTSSGKEPDANRKSKPLGPDCQGAAVAALTAKPGLQRRLTAPAG